MLILYLEATVKVSNSPPMAVLPLNSSSKLDQEPNPFEQSFSGAAVGAGSPSSTGSKDKEKSQPETPNKPVLPPVASITSPAPPVIGNGVLPKDVTNQFAWDSLRTGPLSPSMLAGPTKPNDMAYGNIGRQMHQQQAVAAYMNQQGQPAYTESNPQAPYSTNPTIFVKQNTSGRRHQPRTTQQRAGDKDSEPESTKGTRRKAAADDDDAKSTGKKKARTREKTAEDEEKRKNFLERNRIAALKCRQRKKQWLNNLQAKVEMLTNENEQLQVQAEAMREEIVNLKTLLLAHKDCSIAQNNGFTAATVQKSIPTVMPQQVVRPGSVAAMPRNQPVYTQQFQPDNRSVPGVSRPISTAAPFTQAPTQHYQAPATTMMPMQQPHPPPTQQSMMAGGSTSGILRF
ncbi:hypothetical protein BJV82DRAFT_217688 [Fennellomyces sp. T-0311]|nr:hypothetical protein BJV82DRAFT_217688 [Fennellomyces sp. T-0311]